MLKSVRESQAVSRQSLADSAGVTRQSIHNWENDVGEPSIAQAARMADRLGVDVIVFTALVKAG